MRPEILVVCPLYLDLVLEVDRPLTPRRPTAETDADDPAGRGGLDHSVYEVARISEPSDRLVVRNDAGETIEIVNTSAATLPVTGTIFVDQPLVADEAWHQRVGLTAHRQLPGGMGSGFAAALKSHAVAALGANHSRQPDAAGRKLIECLREADVGLTPQLFSGVDTDTTVLVSSGPHGDKLPIGRRQVGSMLNCNAELKNAIDQTNVLVIAGLHNRLTAELLSAPGAAGYVVFAPTWRNIDSANSVLGPVADQIDYLCCNEEEWQGLDADSWVRNRVALITVTAGTKGATVYFHNQAGQSTSLHVPAFRPGEPPVDTNRAGESFASAFLSCLLDEVELDAMKSGTFAHELIEQAAREAAVAAHLQVQTSSFQFHDRDRIRAAMRQ